MVAATTAGSWMRLLWTAVDGSGGVPAARIRMLPAPPSVSTSLTQLEPMSMARKAPPRFLGSRSPRERLNNPTTRPPSALRIFAHPWHHIDRPPGVSALETTWERADPHHADRPPPTRKGGAVDLSKPNAEAARAELRCLRRTNA